MQGDLDGACFLYSIANCVVALTQRKPSVNQWSNALEYIPFAHDFIDGKVGIKNYDERSELYRFSVEQALSEYSPKRNFLVRVHPELERIGDVAPLVKSNSVVILNINAEHWICVVDVDVPRATLLSVCSDLGDRVNRYKEVECQFGRAYNREYVLDQVTHIHKSSVIQVSLA
jgi:hypothetical protein